MADTKPRDPTFTYENDTAVAETFSDLMGQVYFDGQSLRLEFLVSRLDATARPDAPTGKRRSCARIVMTPNGAIDLMNRLNQLSAALEQAGIMKRNA
jgi:hypothetical protein